MATTDKTLDDLFLDTLKDIYYAEKQIPKALPKMAKAAQSAELKAAFETHRDETEGQVDRLEKVFELLGKRAQGKTCDAIIGIIDEGKEIMEEFKNTSALDAGLLSGRPGRRALRDLPLRHAEGLGRQAQHAGGRASARADAAGGEEDRPAAVEARGKQPQPEGGLIRRCGER